MGAETQLGFLCSTWGQGPEQGTPLSATPACVGQWDHTEKQVKVKCCSTDTAQTQQK